MQANILPFYSPSIPGWGQKVKTFFSEGSVAYISNYKERSFEHCASKMFDRMLTSDGLGWVKSVILIENSDLRDI